MICVKVPATSANFGAGFDSLGAALNYYNLIEMEEYSGCRIEILDDTAVPTDESNLVYQTARALYEHCGRPFPGLHIRQRNRIPTARGLGSSSACIAGGLLGANELLGRPCTLDELVDLAAAMEGHPDNSTPALLGGFVAAAMENGHVYYARCPVPEGLGFVAVIPDFELKTADARRALPDSYVRADAVYNLSRSALMALSMAQGRLENLKIAAGDRLHQPYRLRLIPGAEEVFDFFDRQGAYASYISGAGSTLMALVDAARQEEFCRETEAFLKEAGHLGWKVLGLRAGEGARVINTEEEM
ncbi:MAG: homoserine kinase [Acutalibacteraceae bacterium]